MQNSSIILLAISCLHLNAQPTSALKDSALKYNNQEKFKKALPFADHYAERVARESGKESEAYAYALGLRGELNVRTRKIEEARTDLQACLDLYKKLVPHDNLDVANANHYMGALLLNQVGDPANAEPFLLRADAIKTRLLPEMDSGFIITWRNLGGLYIQTSRFEKAEEYFKKSLAANQKHDPEHPDHVPDAWAELGILYSIWGNFPKAETACLTAIRLFERHYKEEEMSSGPFNTLGHVYDGLGNYPKAEQNYMKAYRIVLQKFPPNHPVQYQMPTSLGGHFVLAGQYEKAVYWLERAIQIRDKLPPEMVEPNAFEEGNLMIAYQRLGLFHKAEAMGKTVIALREKSLGPLHYNTANGYASLAQVYISTNRIAEARVQMNKMGDAYEKSFGSRNPNFETTFNLGQFEWDAGQVMESKKWLTQSMQMMRGDVARYFPALSDHEKSQYYDLQVKPKVAFFTSFSLWNSARFPDLLGEQYNLTLSTKALLLSTSARWKQRIKTSGDKKLFALYTQWEGLQNQLANWHSTAEPGMKKQLDSTLALSEKIEKELSVRSEAYGKMADRNAVTWKHIQAKLKPGEAAIEMVRFQKPGIEKTVVDTSDPKKPTYRVKGLSDTIYYGALIVKPGAIQPEMVLFKNGNELESSGLTFYKNCIRNQVKDAKSYRQFWEKIDKKLGPAVQKVYFSPEGVYHSINLNTLQNPKTGKYLLDEKEIRMVTGTRDLLLPHTEVEQNQLAYLFGFPDYNLDDTQRQTTANKLRNSPELSYSFTKTRGDAMGELPGTKVEVETIAQVLTNKGWEVQTLEGAEALEETLKESLKPRVLHLATHGFFNPDTTIGSNPLLRSGLLLTGANQALNGKISDKAEDGILTAYEAMNLNLDNTDLVVLSACETGLGEIKNGEGVYGLQRAFKVAGAKSIIMSLWKVDDEATQELMVSFYKHWLGPQTPEGGLKQPSGSGSSPSGRLGGAKRSAFLKAQKELKVRYPNPYYWGAFVMVGE